MRRSLALWKRFARALSLILALAASATAALVPFVLARRLTPADHAVLPLMMLGIAGAFVHGFGFVPASPTLRALFSPWVAWPLIVGGGAFVTLHGS